MAIHQQCGTETDSLVYLEGEMTSSNTPSEDVVRRIGRATGVVGSLQTVWRSSDIATDTIFATLQLVCSVSSKTPKHEASRKKTSVSCESFRWQSYETRPGTRYETDDITIAYEMICIWTYRPNSNHLVAGQIRGAHRQNT